MRVWPRSTLAVRVHPVTVAFAMNLIPHCPDVSEDLHGTACRRRARIRYPAQSQTTDLQPLLNEADRLAWLTDWYRAMPLYAEVERTATQSGDTRNALYAKLGRLRGQMQMRSLVEISEEIAKDLDTPLVARDPAFGCAPSRSRATSIWSGISGWPRAIGSRSANSPRVARQRVGESRHRRARAAARCGWHSIGWG